MLFPHALEELRAEVVPIERELVIGEIVPIELELNGLIQFGMIIVIQISC